MFIKVVGSIGAVALLSASACNQQQPPENCLMFNQFSHRQKLPTNPYPVMDWMLLASPNQQIEMYDPSTDRGPKNMIGPLIKGSINFMPTPGRKTYSEVRVTYLSYNAEPTRVRLLDPGFIEVGGTTLNEYPQNVILSYSFSSSQNIAHIVAENESGEAQIASICVR